MSNFGSDLFWQRARLPAPPEDLLGFQLGSGDPPGLSTWRPPAGGPQPVSEGALPAAEAEPPPWWERPTGTRNIAGGEPQPAWPWLGAPTDEVPGFRLNPDGSVPTSEPSGGVRLMSGALAAVGPQDQPYDVAGIGATSPDVPPLPTPGAPTSPALATSVALPASAGGSAELAALAARAGPAMAGLGSAAAAALPLLFIPTNTQSETTGIGDGLRARVRPGQRTVEIERRVDNGLFGSGIGATWKALPVDAELVVDRDGRPSTVIDHRQLNRALGRDVPAESMDAGGSAMALPPKGGAPGSPPAANDPTADRPDGPVSEVPPVLPSAARAAATAREGARAKPRESDEEEERVLACRAVRATPGQPTISGQYNRGDAIDTAVGVPVPPGFPMPKGGYDYAPEYARHWKGFRGELELMNRIRNALPGEIVVHYGNPAGEHGPDVLTVGPDGRLMEWESRYRSAPRRVGPNMARPPSLKYATAADYVGKAVGSAALSREAGDRALQELRAGNYNICTVGLGAAHDGWVELVRNHASTGSRR